MRKFVIAIVSGMAFMGVLAAGCNTKPAEQKQPAEKQMEQKPATEKKPVKGPVGC